MASSNVPLQLSNRDKNIILDIRRYYEVILKRDLNRDVVTGFNYWALLGGEKRCTHERFITLARHVVMEKVKSVYGEQYNRPADALGSVPVPYDAEQFTEEEQFVLADLGLVLKLLPVRDVCTDGVKTLWNYLGGPALIEHGKFLRLFQTACQHVPTRRDEKSDMLVLEKWRGGFQPTTLHSEYEDLSTAERLLVADFARIQTVLSGDEMFTVIDELYNYMRKYREIFDYGRFCELAKMSYYRTVDEPEDSHSKDMTAVKTRFGAVFPHLEHLPGGNDNERAPQQFGMNWLGKTCDGMVGKMNVEQTARLLAVVDATRLTTSDWINWPLVLSKCGLDKDGAFINQIKKKYYHLTKMCGVTTVSQYLTYHREREPYCDTLSTLKDDLIPFPDDGPLHTSDEDPTMVTYISYDDWRRVLVCDSDSKLLVEMDESGWKTLFNSLEIETNRTGTEIMQEFYATVVPAIRCAIFGMAGKNVRMELKDTGDYTMMAIVGAVRDRDHYSDDDITFAIHRLSRQKIISFSMQGPHMYWGEAFFGYLGSVETNDFPGNKQKLAKLKARWGFQ